MNPCILYRDLLYMCVSKLLIVNNQVMDNFKSVIQSKFRKSDEEAADIVAQFLDEHFYNIICKDVERVYDKSRQVKGIDIEFTYNGHRYKCDEKAAIHCANTGLPTFALEISMLNRGGKEHRGWFVDDTKVNDSYMFIWVDGMTNKHIQSVEDIKEVEIILVRREKILNYLSSMGWTLNNLINKSNKIRTNPNEYLGTLKQFGCKFAYSTQLVEKPVNFLLPRETYRKLSDYKAIIKK